MVRKLSSFTLCVTVLGEVSRSSVVTVGELPLETLGAPADEASAFVSCDKTGETGEEKFCEELEDEGEVVPAIIDPRVALRWACDDHLPTTKSAGRIIPPSPMFSPVSSSALPSCPSLLALPGMMDWCKCRKCHHVRSLMLTPTKSDTVAHTATNLPGVDDIGGSGSGTQDKLACRKD